MILIICVIPFVSKQICVPYSTTRMGPRLIPDFDQAKSVEAETFCDPKNSDGSITCKIESPSFALKECYPEKYLCIHQVVCPLTHRAEFRCSGLDLPKAANGKEVHAIF